MLELLAGSGWLVAALLVGLYLGERGRRLDAQRREGAIEVDPVQPATVRTAAEGDSRAPVAVNEALAAARQRYIEEAVLEGYSETAAAKDFDALVNTSMTDQVASEARA